VSEDAEIEHRAVATFALAVNYLTTLLDLILEVKKILNLERDIYMTFS
jgi:hypothetical protein